MTTKAYIRHYLISDLIAFVIIGAFITIPSLALAQEEDENMRAIHHRILNHFDHDGDGKLNDREKYQARKFYARWKENNNSVDRPDRRRPDVDRPDRRRPDVDRPDRRRPDVYRPDRRRPDVSRPDVSRPDVSRPDVRPARDIRSRLDRNNDGRFGQRERQAARRIQARRIR